VCLDKELATPPLSHGEKQWLEIGMLLMQSRSCCCSTSRWRDEPDGGADAALLSGSPGRDVSSSTHALRRDHRPQVTVLHQATAVEGSMQEIQRDQRVVDATWAIEEEETRMLTVDRLSVGYGKGL